LTLQIAAGAKGSKIQTQVQDQALQLFRDGRAHA